MTATQSVGADGICHDSCASWPALSSSNLQGADVLHAEEGRTQDQERESAFKKQLEAGTLQPPTLQQLEARAHAF